LTGDLTLLFTHSATSNAPRFRNRHEVQGPTRQKKDITVAIRHWRLFSSGLEERSGPLACEASVPLGRQRCPPSISTSEDDAEPRSEATLTGATPGGMAGVKDLHSVFVPPWPLKPAHFLYYVPVPKAEVAQPDY